MLRRGLVTRDEHAGIRKVSGAAALADVAAMVQSLLTRPHFLMIVRGEDRE